MFTVMDCLTIMQASLTIGTRFLIYCIKRNEWKPQAAWKGTNEKLRSGNLRQSAFEFGSKANCHDPLRVSETILNLYYNFGAQVLINNLVYNLCLIPTCSCDGSWFKGKKNGCVRPVRRVEEENFSEVTSRLDIKIQSFPHHSKLQ